LTKPILSVNISKNNLVRAVAESFDGGGQLDVLRRVMDWDSRRDIEQTIDNLIHRLLKDYANPNEFNEEIQHRIDNALITKGWSLWADGIWRPNYPWIKEKLKVANHKTKSL